MSKYCASCHHLCENDGFRFCPVCGSPNFIPAATQAPQTNPVYTAQQTVTPPVNNGQAVPTMPPVNNNFAPPPKKKSSLKKILIPIVTICLIIALVAGAVAVSGGFSGAFKSDKGYFASVEKRDIAEFCNSFEAYYDNYLLRNVLSDSKHNIKMSVELSDDLIKNMAKSVDGSLDLGWLNDTALDITVDSSGTKISSDTLISIDGQNVLSAVLLADGENSKLLLKLKEITDDVLSFDMGKGAVSSIGDFDKQLLSQALPEAPVITKLITKYHGIILKHVEKVEKTKEEVSLDDLTETLTVLTCELTEKNVADISLEVLNELKVDKEIKKIFETAEKAMKNNGLDTSDVSYDDFVAGLDEAIDELTGADGADDVVLTLKDYVNSDGEIVGRKIGESGEMLDYLTVESGKDYAKYFDLRDGISYKETGTKQGDRVTAECVFTEEDETLYKIELTDFDVKAFKKGKLDGRIRMFPNSKTVKSAMPKKYRKYAGLFDMAFDIDIKGTSESGEFDLAVLNDEDPVFETKGTYSVTKSDGTEELQGKVVEIKGLDSLSELMGDLHLDELVDNLRKTTVPKEYVDAIAEISDQLKSAS